MASQSRFIVKWFVGIFGLLGLYMALLYTSVAQAQTSNGPTCAIVRCDSGTCIDTPDGPVCQPVSLSCANMFCAEGNVCKETPRGPTCQPAKQPPIQPPHIGDRDGNDCVLVKEYYHGQMVYRRVCPPRTKYKPRKHYRQKYHPRSDRYQRPKWFKHDRYQRPRRHEPAPTPRPDRDRVCAQIYAPVCAQKQLQCVKAPCPPVKQTFSNSCEASRDGYTVIHQGRCRAPGVLEKEPRIYGSPRSRR